MLLKSFADLALYHSRPLWASWYKRITQVAGVGYWFDLTMSPGNPGPQYYTGAQATFNRLTKDNIGSLPYPLLGASVNGGATDMLSCMLLPNSAVFCPMAMVFMDYLGYYPYIDESEAGEIVLDNILGIDRYVDGEGVQMMPVVAAGQTGGQSFYVTYTNSQGQSGRISQTVRTCGQGSVGTVLTGQSVGLSGIGSSPFIPLQVGDTGVKSIESVTLLGSDIGLFTLVLVKPLFTVSIGPTLTPQEVVFGIHNKVFPRLVPGCFLSAICLPATGALTNLYLHGLFSYNVKHN